ncbi:MAG: hypothetical protein IH571_03190, partial [Acholeplasmataceae bacterium]|nr:hypothetical protein [Acholeplasmataceae bacterium]
MKKVFSIVLLLAFSLGFALNLSAAEEGTGNIVFHFHAWDNVYEDGEGNTIGVHAWGDTIAPTSTPTGIDEFGIYFEFNGVEVGTTPGFIAVYFDGESQLWSRKQTGNIEPGDIIVEGETVHVYAFTDKPNADGQTKALIAGVNQYNLIVVYYDPTDSYEETLGVHYWGQFGEASWGSPVDVFQGIGHGPSGVEVMGAMFSVEDPFTSGDGMLIYTGSNKKTGNLESVIDLTEIPENGMGIVYVVNLGTLDNNSNVYLDPEGYYNDAFSFNLAPFNSTKKTGTFAYSPTVVNVRTTLPLTSPVYGTSGEDRDVAIADVEGWFSVKEITDEVEGVKSYGPALIIDVVSFSGAESLQDYVLVLNDANPLDSTKRYELFFDNVDGEAGHAVQIEIDLDKNAPVITFVTSMMEVPIIIVPYGQKWNPNLFPVFTAADDRDGDITH